MNARMHHCPTCRCPGKAQQQLLEAFQRIRENVGNPKICQYCLPTYVHEIGKRPEGLNPTVLTPCEESAAEERRINSP